MRELWAGVLLMAVVAWAAPAPAGSYMLTEHWGGSWSDATKTAANTEDDNMCWAAAAANVLDWTRWGKVAGMTTAQGMFQYFQDHWTDMGGLPAFGWYWWFTGENPAQDWDGWSQVDVPAGGLYPFEDFDGRYLEETTDSAVMAAIRDALLLGYGTTIAIYGGGGHALTVWGYEYGASSTDYLGIYVTDSDDGVTQLRYYGLQYDTVVERWHLQGYFGTSNWYIGAVMALGPMPVPEPMTMLAVVAGGCGLAGYLRRRLAA